MSGFSVSGEAIDTTAFRTALQDRSCGALVVFEGWVRDHNEGRAVRRLEYEVYEPMAVSLGNEILDEARQRFEVGPIRAIHREGLLELGEPAVIVGVAAPHRDAAFRACRYVIDEIKHRLPIWKKEHYADGTADWVDCRQCAQRHEHGGEARPLRESTG